MVWKSSFVLATLVAVVATLTIPVVSVATTPAHAQAGEIYIVDNISDNVALNTCDPAPADNLADCSLRGAIDKANATPGHDTIIFEIPLCSPDSCLITLTEGSIAITESVSIDGTTQTVVAPASPQPCATPSSPQAARVIVRLSNAAATDDVFQITHGAGSTHIHGMGFTNISDVNTQFLAAVQISAGSGHTVTCSEMGTTHTTTASAFEYGVLITGSASNVRVGSNRDGVNDIAEGNIIGNAIFGVYVNSNNDNVVAGNSIGIDADGETPLNTLAARPYVGVMIQQLSRNNLVADNRIGFRRDGILIFPGDTTSDVNTVENNILGLTASGGPAPLDAGIQVTTDFDSVPTIVLDGNTIGNAVTGIHVFDNAAATIVNSSIGGRSATHVDFGNITGIHIETDGTVKIASNDIASNTNGVVVGSTFLGVMPTLTGSTANCLVDNSDAFENIAPNTVVFANNWWGSPSGPGSPGNSLSGPVTVHPVRTTPAGICAANAAPDAGPDISETVSDTTLVGQQIATILATDPNGDALSYSVTNGDEGPLALGTDGAIVVAANLGAASPTTIEFTVTVSDGDLSDSAEVSITITEDGSPPPPPPGISFVDVGTRHLFHSDIIWLAEQGITKGCNPPINDKFCPDNPVTRAQMASFMRRALEDILTPDTTTDFTDDNTSIHEADIEWLASVGVTKGCNPPTNDKYCPDNPVTRAQMASFMRRALEDILTPDTTTDFTDDNTSIHEADIEWLASVGVTKGCNPPTNDKFCPDNPVTRAQMAAFINRALADA